MSGRLLGVDLGERRIGLAIADEDGLAARPLATVRRARDLAADAATLRRVVDEQRVTILVVGLPLEASGAEGPMATAAREWGTGIAALLDVPVRFRDERLSSHLAEQRLGPMGRGRSGGPPSPVQRERYRERVDREAAAIILQDELDANRPSTGSFAPAGVAGPAVAAPAASADPAAEAAPADASPRDRS